MRTINAYEISVIIRPTAQSHVPQKLQHTGETSLTVSCTFILLTQKPDVGLSSINIILLPLLTSSTLLASRLTVLLS